MNRTPRVILLVEDNADDAELTLRAFDRLNTGNRMVLVGDGQEALDFLFADGRHAGRDPALTPSVVLLDLKLPELDGLEVLRKIRADARTRRLPVVILTSSREDKDIVQSYDLGANSFVRKPVDFTLLAEAVRQLGTYWLDLNEPPPGGGRA